MHSQCIEKLPHDCGSHDALQVFEEDGKYTGFCFSCRTYVADPYHDKPVDYKPVKFTKSAEQIAEELREIGSYPHLALMDRRLNKETIEYFNIRVGVSEEDGKSPVVHCYPYGSNGITSAYKVRNIEDKHFWCVGSMEGADLFGWHQACGTGAKRLYITEGELDAASLYQVLVNKNKGTQYEKFKPAVVSLTRGAAGVRKDLIANLDRINATFKEVVFVFDMDVAGQEATNVGLQIIPSALSLTLPAKDPSECLMTGRGNALTAAALFNAGQPKNTRLVWGSALHEAGREQAVMGLSWPWPGLTKLTRGIRFGETYYLGAGVKMGKSELVNSIGAHLITEHGMKIFMAKPEEANRKTYQMVCGKVAGRIFHDPEVEFDYDAYDEASKRIGDKLCMLSLYQHLGWSSLKTDILVAVSQGCKAVFIDPITNLVNGQSSGETNTVLQEIAQELAAMAKDLNIVIFIFCHLKAPLVGESHERGGKVFSHQFSGSRAMMRSCNLMLGLEGNKDPDLEPEIRNLRKLSVLEDREFGAVGTVRLYWDPKTSLFNEIGEK